MPKMEHFHFRLEAEDKARIQKVAQRERMPASTFVLREVMRVVDRYLAENGGEL